MVNLFERPHRCICATHIEMTATVDTLRAVATWAALQERIAEELEVVYSSKPGQAVVITYSTKQNPTLFSSEVNEKTMEQLRTHDELTLLALTLTAEVERADRNIREKEKRLAEDPAKRRTRDERRQDKAELKALEDLRRRLADTQYQITCAAQKLANVFSMEAIRVEIL